MTTDYLALAAKAKELAEAATAGPWTARDDTATCFRVRASEYNVCNITNSYRDPPSDEPDAVFIAASRTLVPQLAAAVEELVAQSTARYDDIIKLMEKSCNYSDSVEKLEHERDHLAEALRRIATTDADSGTDCANADRLFVCIEIARAALAKLGDGT